MIDTLRKLFAEICNGYSPLIWRGRTVYVKHLSHFDQVEIDTEYQRFYDLAKARKIPTTAEKLVWLSQQGIWTKKDDSELRGQSDYLEGLRKTKQQLIAASQIKEMENTINATSAKIYELTARKNNLIDLTCEQYAEQKMQSYYIYLSFCVDKTLEIPLFTKAEFMELEDEELDELNNLYYVFVMSFSAVQLKRLAVAPFFMSYFYIGEIDGFFACPTCELTYYQLNLLSYAIHFKRLFEANDIPEAIRGDPDKIEASIDKNRAIKAAMSKVSNKGGRSAVVGVSRADLEAAGIKTETQESFKEVGNIRDAMRVYGE